MRASRPGDTFFLARLVVVSGAGSGWGCGDDVLDDRADEIRLNGKSDGVDATEFAATSLVDEAGTIG